MQAALHIKTKILPGGKIEITDPDLPTGEAVEVIVLRTQSDTLIRRSAVDILAEAPGHRLFNTAEQVDAYLREERDSWDR